MKRSPLPILFFFSAGCIAGLFAFLFLVSLLTLQTLSTFLADHGDTLAALATFAAVVVAWVVHLEQLEYQEKRNETDRIKKNNVFRAHMHAAVVDLMRYTEQCFLHIHTDLGDARLPIPTPPLAAIQLLSNSIESADDISSNSLREIVSSIQIFGSRLESRQNFQSEMERTLLSLHLQIENILPYARHDQAELTLIPKTLASLQDSLRSITRQLEPDGAFFNETRVRLNHYYA